MNDDYCRCVATLDRRRFLASGAVAAGLLGTGIGTVTAQSRGPSWTHFRGGPRRAGQSSVDSPPEPQQIRWSLGLGDTLLSPAVVGDSVFVGDTNGSLLKLDRLSGSVEWQTSLSGAVHYAPTYVDGTLYVGTRAGDVHVLDAESGDEVWSQPLEGEVMPPAVDGDRLFVATTVSENEARFKLYAFDAESGDLHWDLRRDSRFNIDDMTHLKWPIPAISGDSVVANFSWNGRHERPDTVGSYAQESGEIEWERGVDDIVGFATAPAVDDGSLYLAGDEKGLVRLSTATGGESWASELQYSQGRAEVATVGDNLVVFFDYAYYDKPVYKAFDKTDGSQEWSTTTDDKGTLVSTTGSAFHVVLDGVLTEIDGSSGLVNWEYEFTDPGEGSGLAGMEPIPTPDGFLVTYNGTLYMLGDGSAENATPASTPRATVTDADGASGSDTANDIGDDPSGSSADDRRNVFGTDVLSSASMQVVSTVVTVLSVVIGVLQLMRGGD